MDTFAAIESRRSVKHYDKNHQLSQEEIDHLFSMAILSPTSFNIQNWRFVLIENPDLRQQVHAAAWGQAQVADASLLIAICADLKAWKNDPSRYFKDAPAQVAGQMVPMIVKFYEGNEQLQRDEAIRSCGIAAQTLMLTAKAMGYDSNPMIGFDPDAIAKIINLPEDHIITMLLAVGKAAQPARPRNGQLPLNEVFFKDQF
jgi:nitroreductase